MNPLSKHANATGDGLSGAAAAGPPPGTRWSVHWMVGPLLGVAALMFSRAAVFFLRPQFFAEDAAILFLDARSSGWHSFFRPWPGYYIMAERLVACSVSGLPARYLPAVYCYAALAYTLLTAWFCLRARVDHLMDRRGRIALALAIALVPQDGEVFMKLVAAQWILAAILPVLILQEPPSSPRQAVVDFCGLLLAGMTGPFIVLCAPWFLVRLFKAAGGFSRYNLLLVGTAGCMAAVQFRAILRVPLPQVPMTREAGAWLKQLGFTLPSGLFFGAATPLYLGRAFYVISPALLLLLGWALWRGERKRRRAAVAMCGCGAFIYAGGLRTLAYAIAVLSPFGGGSRYFYPIYLFCMWTAVVYCYDRSGTLRAAARIALAMMLLASASDFTSPPWPNLHWENYAESLDAGTEPITVPILPSFDIRFPATR